MKKIRISRLVEKREEKIERSCHEVAHSAISTLRRQKLNDQQLQDLYETFGFKGTVALWNGKKNRKEGKFLSRLKPKQMEDALSSILKSHLRQYYFGCDVVSITFKGNNDELFAFFEMRRY